MKAPWQGHMLEQENAASALIEHALCARNFSTP